MPVKYRRMIAAGWLALLLVACASPAAPSTVTPVAAPSDTALPSPSEPASVTSTVPAPTRPVLTPTLPPTAEAETPAPTQALPREPVGDPDNLYSWALGPVSAPEGWSVQPCEGDPVMLCVWSGADLLAMIRLALLPIETMTDFQAMLAEAGLPPGKLDLSDPAHQTRLKAALEQFVDSYHAAIEADRQALYGERVQYVRLETQATELGHLPGLQFGFAGLQADGSAYERWITYVAYDGDLLYLVTAAFSPDAYGAFATDAALQQFLPHLTPIVAGLELPFPVLETEVQSVRARRPLEIFRAFGDPGNPVGYVAAGETVPVTGLSVNEQHWRVDCPDGVGRNCWISASADATEPLP